MKGKNIIMLANQPWDMASNCRNISIELSRANRILYVNPPLDRKILVTKANDPYVKKIKAIINGKLAAVEAVDTNIWILYPDFLAESINWIPVPFIHDILNKWNNRKFANAIGKAMHQLQLTDPVIFNDNVIVRGFYLKEMLKPSLSIYYIRDYLISQPYYKKHGRRLEKELIAKSDMVLANSLFLKDYAAQYNPNAHYVGQGCEIEIFNPDLPLARPVELEGIKKPIVGYIGYLTSFRLDIGLIEYIARVRKDWEIVLVGPENQEFKDSALHMLDNVIFTGNKDPESLPQYLQHFDVCINPQLVNDLTIGNYPRKIDEYLAMGKPTVATRTKAMEAFIGFCSLATSKEEYIDMIEASLNEDSAERKRARINVARSHSWEKNVADMCQMIEDNMEKVGR